MKKKLLAILLVMSFSITFAGCNLEELGFLNTVRMMSSLTEFTFDGSTTLKVDKYEENADYTEDPVNYDALKTSSNNIPFLQKNILSSDLKLKGVSPSSVLGRVADISEEVFATVGEQSLLYNGMISKVQKKIVLNLDVKNLEGTTTSIIKLIINDKTLYIDKTFLDSYDIEYANEETIDSVVYGKFTTDELIQNYFDMMRENTYDGPSGYAIVDTQTNSADYVIGYRNGFSVGEQDGYFGTETPYTDTENLEQDSGFTDGYNAGVISGELDKTYYDQQMADLNTSQEDLSAMNIGATTIIDTLITSDHPIIEEIVNTLFADFSLSLVKKDGNSKYVIDMDANDMIDSLSKTLVYILDNEALVKTTLKAIVTKIPADYLGESIMDSVDIEELNDFIDDIYFPIGDELVTEKKDLQDMFESMKEEMNEVIDFNFLYSLEKVGSVSYETSSTISVKSKENTEIPFDFDIKLISLMSINKALDGDVKVAQSLATNGQTSAKIKLDVTDENFVETGILVSKNEDFSNPTMVPAIKQVDGTYVADLSGLDPNAKYFYKSYTKDGSGNLVFSFEVKTFNTLMAISPPTGDTSSPWPIVVFIGAAVAILAVLFLMKKKK